MGYGLMQLVGPNAWGAPQDRAGALRLLRHTAELGINFFNSANVYGPHVANDLLAQALHPYSDVVIGNKIGPTRGPDGSWGLDPSPASLRQQLQDYLRRLKLDTAELIILRADGDLPDAHNVVPWEDSVGALADFQRQGHVKRVGVSGVTPDQLRQAQAIVRVEVVENCYHLLDRRGGAVLAACEAHGIAFTPYCPLGDGHLPADAPALAGAARRLGATPAQVALAWLLRRSAVMVPIPGTKSLTHLEENVAAGALVGALSEDEIAGLTALTPEPWAAS
jgi:aryl-alcohol dehydrogenase-like predicted oxidoreductase